MVSGAAAMLSAGLLSGMYVKHGGAEWTLDRNGNVHLHSVGDATEAYAMRDAVQRMVDEQSRRTSNG